MAPVPAKTLRLSELNESDRTAYFSVTALMGRRKAVGARSQPLPPTAAPLAPAAVEPAPEGGPGAPPTKPGVWQQVRAASPARQGILVLLPLLLGLVALRPVFKAHEESRVAHRADADAARQELADPKPVPSPLLAPTPPGPPPSLPKGVTLERAATDALLGGDYPRALGFYRELSRQHPEDAAYREAARILERREREKQP